MRDSLQIAGLVPQIVFYAPAMDVIVCFLRSRLELLRTVKELIGYVLFIFFVFHASVPSNS